MLDIKKEYNIINQFVTLIITMFIMLPAISHAEMKILPDGQLSEITGHGFSSLTLENNTALIELNIQSSTYTQIDSVKLGYYDNGLGSGWDQNWTNVSMGSPSQDLVLKDFFLKAEFENINDSVNRQLKSIQIGFNDVSGYLSANFESLSRITGNDSDFARQPVGNTQYQFINDQLYVSIEVSGPNRGIWVNFGNAQPVP